MFAELAVRHPDANGNERDGVAPVVDRINPYAYSKEGFSDTWATAQANLEGTT